jgi:hypothetical protein
MKLQIKHIIPYLPYGLKFLYHGNIYKMRWINSIGDIDYNSQNDFIDPFPPNIFNKELDLVKLIFRPLSDLTKEIEVNGEKFVPIERLFELEYPANKGGKHNPYYYDTQTNYTRCSHCGTSYHLIVHINSELIFKQKYWIIQKLFEWHFNVFNLPENLFIDINTLNLE